MEVAVAVAAELARLLAQARLLVLQEILADPPNAQKMQWIIAILTEQLLSEINTFYVCLL